ncbi:MAG: Response regulator of the LytR/AlgR family [uncultured bacterium]|nr:MAG: Response regulator of the LytR/AlgR family [uncultured bacterium]
MKVLILEDEVPAQMQLKRLLSGNFPEFEVAASISSIISAAEWLRNNTADLIFMDVELSDGICFELFNLVEINSCIIITTAYESYALEAFRVNSIDYLLKPLDEKLFVKAVEKCIRMKSNSLYTKEMISKILATSKVYKQRFTVKLGTKIIVINTADIAYFYAENKSTFIVTKDKRTLLSDFSLEAIEDQLNPSLFFKLSRSCIAGIDSIESISRHFNSRLKVLLTPPLNDDIYVSRVRVPAFLEWLEGKVPD